MNALCHAIGADPIYLNSYIAERNPLPRGPFHRRRGCHGLAAGARGRCGRAHAAPTCAPGPRLQSDFCADFCAAVLMLCDPVSCCMARKRDVKKLRGRREKERVLCATP